MKVAIIGNGPSYIDYDGWGDVVVGCKLGAPLPLKYEFTTNCNPKILVCANAFKPDSIGHFDNYSHGSEVLTPKEISREFTKFLKDNGYIKLKTKLWNQRPTIYLRGGLHLL
jgi:histidinol phosphatase-like PHP family hydrolase